MTEIIQYILRFMVGEQLPDDINRLVGYVLDIDCFTDYKVVIIPSNFFNEGVYGNAQTIPAFPVQTIEGVPFLFGTPDIERVGDTIVVHADLVASAFFLLSRYEEILYRDKRDVYGRFPGRESLSYRAGFIDRPVVDEYGKLIRKWLCCNGVSIPVTVPYIRKINLTHDVDAPFSCRTWRNVARNVFTGHNLFGAIRTKFGHLENDPYYTFPWILQQNKTLQHIENKCRNNSINRNRHSSNGETDISAINMQHTTEERCCRSVLFFKADGKTKNDKPRYDLYGKDIRALFALCRAQGVTVGLHSSFQAGIDPSLIASEKKKLEEAYGTEICHNRHHFLSSREPEDMEYLEKAGFTDDYTLGYADIAGFRLGTSFPVHYINPATRRLTSLTLHPLIIMDGTLSDPAYMNLTAFKAEDYCKRLIRHIRQVNGDLTLLWHNTTVVEGKNGYHKTLYEKLINELKIEFRENYVL